MGAVNGVKERCGMCSRVMGAGVRRQPVRVCLGSAYLHVIRSRQAATALEVGSYERVETLLKPWTPLAVVTRGRAGF
jgi:hypothetical protein